jgi:hypothetical protein
MLAAGAGVGDNDRSFPTLLNGIDRNEDWMFEDDYWKSAKMGLIAINDDNEQSGVYPPSAVSTAREWKEDPADVVFHSIAGTGAGTCAVPFISFKDAVDLTGGAYLSICEPDWHDHMRQIAAGSVVGGRQEGGYFVPLSGTPLRSSIRVELDGRNLPANWRYDAGSNAIVFDSTYAIAGRDVVVTYRGSSECGSG